MWRKLFAILVISGLISFLGIGGAHAATLSWTATTTYTDGTPIEVTKIVTYDVQVDGVSQATAISGTSWVIPQSLIGHSKTLSFTVRAVLSTGEVSAYSLPLGWTSPAGIPSTPAGLSVTP